MPGPVNQNRNSSSAPVVFILGGVALIFGLLMAILSQGNADAHNNDVKTGEVKVSTQLFKICDGPNLVYTIAANGIAVSPNDPQCK